MRAILGNVQEVKNGPGGPYSIRGYSSNDSAEELSHDLLVLRRRDVRQLADAAIVELDTVNGRHALESGIQLWVRDEDTKPLNDVLDNSLIELVKDVGRNCIVDVGMWKLGPEWLDDSGESGLLESSLLLSLQWLSAGTPDGPSSCSRITIRIQVVPREIRLRHITLRASGSVASAADETLLRVICDVRSYDGKAVTNGAVTASHHLAFLAFVFERLDNNLHAVMEKTCAGLSFFGRSKTKTFEVSRRQVPDENPGVAGVGSANVGVDIAKGHVDGVRTCSAIEEVELGLVRGENESKKGPI